MDVDGYVYDDSTQLELDLGDAGGGHEPPPEPGEGGPGRGRRHGLRRQHVWPWILGIVSLLALERVMMWGVLQLDASWLWVVAIVGAVGAGAIIAVGGSLVAARR